MVIGTGVKKSKDANGISSVEPVAGSIEGGGVGGRVGSPVGRG